MDNHMHLLALSLVLLRAPQDPNPFEVLQFSRSTIGSGVDANVRSLFARPEDGESLYRLASWAGGYPKLKAHVIPAPPGFESDGKYWVTFHTFQQIEQHHDPIYPVIRTAEGWKLGKEIPEYSPSSHRVKSGKMDVHLFPANQRATITSVLTLEQPNPGAAPVFRLNDLYTIDGASSGGKKLRVVTAGDENIPQPAEGDLVRAGGLLIYWSKKQLKDLTVDYQIKFNGTSAEDKITDKVAYLSANWVPNIGRLPFTTTTRIRGPVKWVLRSEGSQIKPEETGFPAIKPVDGEQVIAFKCDLPISYPKICAGAYQLAAEGQDRGRTFRAWHMDVNKARAEKDVQTMIDFCRFFDEKLVPFPFKSYEVFDGVGYYGIESYSYTILAPNITGWATSHEMGHTYFGGMAPCAYTRDTWNESMTQYIDSVVFLKNRDNSLQQGLRTVGLNVPLSKMDIAWANGNATYMRGAYVMNMLAQEIGEDNMFKALRIIVTERQGKDTVWAHLREPFERAAGRKLDWFWDQWIDGSTFPTITPTDASVARKANSYSTQVNLKQSGTVRPFRMKLLVRVRRGAQVEEKVVDMSTEQAGFLIESSFAPSQAEVEVFPYTLARAGNPIPVR
jgi:hypothetical protein